MRSIAVSGLAQSTEEHQEAHEKPTKTQKGSLPPNQFGNRPSGYGESFGMSMERA